ncbi:hypothetical protein TARUN_4429 [Trichoderma arundinaceum]|uniref:Uncharacterized protein n=1 Tax=Trichoderma arundinaceum TaxID=490622 RepID=A0A395NP54_TRIAR|nr:hypothetical protein TARUN_4429 [Trichoderma arundinaceum]
MVASVASNVSGITFGALYILLRSHKMQKIGPLGHIELGGPRKEKTIESWPSTDIFNTQIEQPVSPARVFQSRTSTRSAASEETMEKNDEAGGYGTIRATPNGDAADDSQFMNVPLTPVVPRVRKDSYSLFPSQRETLDNKSKGAAILLPSTTYTPMGSNNNTAPGHEMFEELLPPPSIRISGAPRHNRDSSLVSSATVQIGLRVSNLSDVTRLEAPFFLAPEGPFSPRSPNWPLNANKPLYTAASRVDSVALDDGGYNDSARSPIRATVEVRHEQTAEAQEDKPITLSPTVYSPNKAATPPGARHHKGMASNPSSPGIAVTDDRYSVGTAEWI